MNQPDFNFCPFCGRNPITYTTEPHKHTIGKHECEHPGEAFAECPGCQACMSAPTIEELAKKWNMRVIAPEHLAAIEALESSQKTENDLVAEVKAVCESLLKWGDDKSAKRILNIFSPDYFDSRIGVFEKRSQEDGK
jgi:hypothetical protein